MGPTATGKTALALKLAQCYPIEIISVDSVLIYRDMVIGAAKPTSAELSRVSHHLIDIISPLESYSVMEFLEASRQLINDILARGKIPLLAGGTMMYFNAFLNGLSKLPQSDINIRANLEEQARDKGLTSLYQELIQVDCAIAIKINAHDSKRIIRALEVYRLTGTPISVLQQETMVNVSHDFDMLLLALMPSNRELLHQRINTRFEDMVASGFVAEVRMLQQKYPELTINHTSQRSVGYLQVWQYLLAEINEVELILQGQAHTRQLAKRQLTWLRSFKSQMHILDDPSLDLDILFRDIDGMVKAFLKF